MYEYKLKSLPTPLKRKLNAMCSGIAEEKFKGRKSWLVYSDDNIDALLDSFDVEYSSCDVQNSGWEELWKDYMHDGWLTKSVYYCFERKVFEAHPQAILINPALAFGTGSHATTQVAAQLLEDTVTGKSVLDIGTGSGILSILASIKGARAVYACDVDAVALNNTRENIKLNACNNIEIWAGGMDSVSQWLKPDVIVANIISSVLLAIHTQILEHNPEYIVYSGILHNEFNSFMAKIKSEKYSEDDVLNIDNWCGVRLKRIDR